MEIHRATAQDAPGLARLRCDFFRAMEPDSDADYPMFYRQLLDYLPAALERESLLAVVAAENGEIVGTAFLTPQERPLKPGSPGTAIGYVTNMYTLPAHRRKGAGRAMLESLIALARQRGLAELDLTATEDGLPLYQAAGFAADKNPFMRLRL